MANTAQEQQRQVQAPAQVQASGPFEMAATTYSAATAQATALASLGTLMKWLGVFVIIGGVLVGLQSPNALGMGIACVGLGVGLGLIGMGALMQALGQLLLALINTAVNTKVTADKVLEGRSHAA